MPDSETVTPSALALQLLADTDDIESVVVVARMKNGGIRFAFSQACLLTVIGMLETAKVDIIESMDDDLK